MSDDPQLDRFLAECTVEEKGAWMSCADLWALWSAWRPTADPPSLYPTTRAILDKRMQDTRHWKVKRGHKKWGWWNLQPRPGLRLPPTEYTDGPYAGEAFPTVRAACVTSAAPTPTVRAEWRVLLWAYPREVTTSWTGAPHRTETIWMPVYGDVLAMSDPLPRDEWRGLPDDGVTAFVTRILGPPPPVPPDTRYWELWALDSGNRIGVYGGIKEALDAVLTHVEANPGWEEHLSLGQCDLDGSDVPETVLTGTELLTLARRSVRQAPAQKGPETS